MNESLLSVRQWLHSLLASPDSEFNLKDAATGTFKASFDSDTELDISVTVSFIKIVNINFRMRIKVWLNLVLFLQ